MPEPKFHQRLRDLHARVVRDVVDDGRVSGDSAGRRLEADGLITLTRPLKGAADASRDDYTALFPDAGERLGAAAGRISVSNDS